MDQHDLKKQRAPRRVIAPKGYITIEKSAELVRLNIETVVAKYAPIEENLRARVRELERALVAIIAITDGSQPRDYPGALMVARSALNAD